MCELWLQLDRTAKRLDCLLMLRLKMESEPEVNVSLGDRRRSFKELPEPSLSFRVRATLQSALRTLPIGIALRQSCRGQCQQKGCGPSRSPAFRSKT